jgi:hypothetical protein
MYFSITLELTVKLEINVIPRMEPRCEYHMEHVA